VEIFIPKVGFTGLLGMALMICGFSSYYIDGFKIYQIVSIVIIITFILAFCIMLELILESKNIINNPDRYKFRTYNEQSQLSELVGKTGRAVTNIDFGGTIDIGGKLYYSISSNVIAKGTNVQVIGINNNTLIVK
jgi:membrane-bound ClpP family serine protease